MALNASTNWYVRAGGNALNGGGWDAAIAGAGVNYADADAAILSPTDLATSGAVATVTSAAGGFTANMVGNCLRIASGTNFTPGYYFVVTYTDANTIVLDRACATAAGSGGTGRIGGAFPTPWSNLPTGGTVTAPTLTSPLAAGHTVWIRGAGLDDPSTADYTLADNLYPSYPNGSLAVGPIRWIGYNGRPLITGYALYSTQSWTEFAHLSLKALGIWNAGTMPDVGLIDGGFGVMTLARDCIFDQAGFDRTLSKVLAYEGCEFRNSGSTADGTRWALGTSGSQIRVFGCKFLNLRGGIWYQLYGGGFVSVFEESVVAGCKTTGPAIRCQGYPNGYLTSFRNCSFWANGSHAIAVDGNTTNDAVAVGGLRAFNNVFVGNGGYGISVTGTLAANDILRGFVDHNAFYNNTSGAMYLLTAGPNDITLTADPFTDAAGGDFTLNATAGGGADCKSVAFPTTHPAS